MITVPAPVGFFIWAVLSSLSFSRKGFRGENLGANPESAICHGERAGDMRVRRCGERGQKCDERHSGEEAHDFKDHGA